MTYKARVRDWEVGIQLPTSEGYLEFENIEYLVRDCEEDQEGFGIEVLYKNKWVRCPNIDFE